MCSVDDECPMDWQVCNGGGCYLNLDEVEMYRFRDQLEAQLKDVIPGTKTHSEWTNELKKYNV